MGKKIALSILCLITIFSMAGCGDKKVKKENIISYDEVKKQYENYIKDKKYVEFSNKWDTFQKEPYYYSIFDIDQNGIPEMIIANDTLNYPNSLVYTYDVNKKEVILLKEIEETYGVLRYSKDEHSLVYNDFKSFNQYASLTYLKLNDNKLEEKGLMQDGDTYYIIENDQKTQISEENGYTLSYGKYKSSIEDAEFTLNKDGTFAFNGVYYFGIDNKTQVNGTYEVKEQSIEDGVTGESFLKSVIIFTYKDNTVLFIISDNNLFKSQEDSFIYQGM